MDIEYVYSYSVREVFLAMLAGSGGYGYEIKRGLEREFASVLPEMNGGQVYSTLARLERDGLITGHDDEGDSRGKRVYELTEAGRSELDRWLATPTSGARLKDEFFVRFVVASSAGLARPEVLLAQQRREYLQSVRDLDARLAEGVDGLAGELLLEGALLHAQADLEWLDLIERRMDLVGATP
jgi:DNA-binding PadR family transcriptional regulator